ncbi:MAG: hypothetical protein L3K52_18005 [Candidatus Thiothrix sulfatifontis]|nr:MAG: hypothetical protein L3K52_18005 [Candidatus Thiothrix sulfatifontis]
MKKILSTAVATLVLFALTSATAYAGPREKPAAAETADKAAEEATYQAAGNTAAQSAVEEVAATDEKVEDSEAARDEVEAALATISDVIDKVLETVEDKQSDAHVSPV